MAGGKDLLLRRPVPLGREGDPVEAAAEGINATGFQVDGQASGLVRAGGGSAQLVAECFELVLERLPPGDHHEAGACRRRTAGRGGEVEQAVAGVARLGPGVFGVAPGAAHRAARQADEEGAAAGMEAFALQRVEGLDDRQGQRSQGGHALRGLQGMTPLACQPGRSGGRIRLSPAMAVSPCLGQTEAMKPSGRGRRGRLPTSMDSQGTAL